VRHAAPRRDRRAHRRAVAPPWNGDILWYTLRVAGEEVDCYDSRPGYFDGTDTPPAGGNADALCRAFGRPDAIEAVDAALHGEAAEVLDGDERHRRLVAALGLPKASMTGFGHIAIGGQLPDGVARDALILVGAPEPGAGHPPLPASFEQPLVRAIAPLSVLIGDAPLPFYQAVNAVMQRVFALVDADGVATCDDALRAVLGVDRIAVTDAMPRIVAMLHRV
jgi:hypothetical protein